MYFIDFMWNMNLQLPDKDQSLLEERIKRAAKSRPPPQVQQVTSAARNVNTANNNNNGSRPGFVPPPTAPACVSNNNLASAVSSAIGAASTNYSTNGSMLPPHRPNPLQTNTVLQPANMNTTVTLSPGKDMEISPREISKYSGDLPMSQPPRYSSSPLLASPHPTRPVLPYYNYDHRRGRERALGVVGTTSILGVSLVALAKLADYCIGRWGR